MYTYSLVQWFLFFYIYCFLGWVWESSYVSIKQKRWVNRGFMHGPFLPIYGSGAIMVLIVTLPVKDNMFLVFLLGMIGATLLEYVTGALMESMFHVRYWDYSQKPFNLNGHICLVSSLAWGGFSILMTLFLHQPIEAFVLMLPKSFVEFVTLALSIGIAIDLTQSFNEAMDLKEMLSNMTENSEEIKKMKKRLDVIMAVIDEETKELREKAEEEKKKYEEKVKAKVEKTVQLKLSAQKALELNLSRSKEKQSMLLRSLTEKINTYTEIAAMHLKGPEGSISVEVEKMLSELKQIKDNIIVQQRKLSSLANRQVSKSAKMLSRNPGAVSKHYEEALRAFKSLSDKEQ